MDARGTLRGLALLAFLLLALHLTRPDPGRDLAPPLLPGFAPAETAALAIRDGAGEHLFVRAGTAWRFGDGEGAAARGDLIERFLVELALAGRYLELPDADPDADGFGLRAGRGYSIIRPGATVEVRVGSLTPNGEGRYAAVDGAVVVTGKGLDALLVFGPRALRERKAFDFDPARVARLEVTGTVEPLALARDLDRFRVTVGGRDRTADAARAETALADLARVESVFFAPRERAEPLDGPEADAAPRVVARDEAGHPLAEFTLHGAAPEGGTLARSRGGVFLIPADLAARLLSPPAAWRTRAPLDFDLTALAAVVFARPGTAPVEFRREHPGGPFARRDTAGDVRLFSADSVETALLPLLLMPVIGHLEPTEEPRCAALPRDHALALRAELADGRSRSLLLPRAGTAEPFVYALPDDEFRAVDGEAFASAWIELNRLLDAADPARGEP